MDLNRKCTGHCRKTYVNVNIHQKENADKLKALAQLPDSCAASATCLQQQREIFQKHNVFSPTMIDGIISKLTSYNDLTLRNDLKIIRKGCWHWSINISIADNLTKTAGGGYINILI